MSFPQLRNTHLGQQMVVGDIGSPSATTQTWSGSDTVAMAEALLKEVQLRRQETPSFAEALGKLARIVRGDTVSFTEGLTALRTRIAALGESVGLTESLSVRRVLLVTVADTLSLAEGFAKQVNKAVAETVALTEHVVTRVHRSMAEGVALTEARVLRVGRVVSDALGLTEALTAIRATLFSTGESVSLSETLSSHIVPGGASAPHTRPLALYIGVRL